MFCQHLDLVSLSWSLNSDHVFKTICFGVHVSCIPLCVVYLRKMGHLPTPVLDNLVVFAQNMIFYICPWGYPTEMEVCWKYVGNMLYWSVLVVFNCILDYPLKQIIKSKYIKTLHKCFRRCVKLPVFFFSIDTLW